jgi:flagellar basal-body rod modification protein FlgD
VDPWYGATNDMPGERVETRKPGGELDKDAFLKLLVTQLQHQDPLNPTEDKEFISQMAQLTTAEQMKNMSRAFAHTQAYNLMGLTVKTSAFDGEDGRVQESEGLVTAVNVKKGEAFVVINDVDVPVGNVEKITFGEID